MWGNISVESVHQYNFNTGFSSNKSDILVHLSQWQYWWWFWFSAIWCLYLLIINKTVKFRSLKMRPKLATTFRTHAKWGDFLAAVIPICWCFNIITNSTTILRMIEWQNETSLFTVRIRARQWYWIYKFELKNFTDILTTPKNVGHNKWQVATFGELQTSDDYLHILQLRAQNKWIKKYWTDVVKKSAKVKKSHLISSQEQLKTNTTNIFDNEKNYSLVINATLLHGKINNKLSNIKNKLIFDNLNGTFTNYAQSKQMWSTKIIADFPQQISNTDNRFLSCLLFDDILDFKKKKLLVNRTSNKIFFDTFFHDNNSFTNNLVNYADFNDTSRWLRRSLGVNLPVRFIKLPLNLETELFKDDSSIFRLRFNDNDTTIKHKNIPHTTYLVIKQKRYKRKKAIPAVIKYAKDNLGHKTKKVKFIGHPYLLDNSVIAEDIGDTTVKYRLIKKNKLRNEVVPISLAKRLIRVKRTLVVPAQVNITFITNSYDVIHSWFIPGLGIKLDCVPGRSTHHTFFIDNVGFYYGMCAEICGRYHHHMPIRVCALPFEHFLVWWQTFGMPKLLFTTNQKRYETYYAFRKYVW